MVAMLGCIFHNADIEFPGYLSLSQQLKFSDVPNGFAGIFKVPAAGIAQILLFTGLIEMAWWPASKYDGDYGVGFFGAKFDSEKKAVKLQAEMANGRLAM
ncbi:chlorophyll a/b-binding protein domain-containing protein [Pelagophyceae sp. CCMP2097]|nr:chlorophyll a/b-binding protein domain-containing protein [Pelagophyceae sp. CCMP2097]